MAISAKGIRKTFGGGLLKKPKKEVLKGIDLQVEEGEIFGILGPNGAGKTTLISCLSTMSIPEEGEISIFGKDSVNEAARIKEMVNISSGNPNFAWSMTVFENLNFYAMLYGMDSRARRKKISELLELLDLAPHIKKQYDELSTGLKQRLSLAKSLLNDPIVLFLDEPTVGLDPQMAIKIRKVIKKIHKEKNVTIILTTHYMREAEELCDRIAFLKEGQIIATGTSSDLENRIRMGDRIIVEVDFAIPINLKLIPGIINMKMAGNLFEITVDCSRERLDDIMRSIQHEGMRITHLHVLEPDLEAVFLELAK